MNFLRRIFGRQRIYGELTDEIQAHLDEKTEELIAAGMSRDDAAAAARRAFGNTLRVEERSREVWEWLHLESLLRAMRLRRLARRGWFLPVEVVLLAVGIATALLSLSAARIGLSTALRVPNPSRTFFVGRGSGPLPRASYPDVASWRERKSIFSRVAAFSVGQTLAEYASKPFNLGDAEVMPGMTSFLPQRMAAGRPLADSDFFPGSTNALVSDALVKRLGLESPVGTLLKGGWAGFRIVGVLPRWSRFPYPNQPDLIMPTVPANPQDPADDWTVLGELRPGLTREEAERELNSAPGGGQGATQPLRLVSMKASLDPASVRISEYGLGLGLLTLLMLIATAALVELLDAIRGKKERAIKLSLGATQGRLVLERTLEVLVICVLGTAAGGLLVAVSWPWFAGAWTADWVTAPRLDGFTFAALGALLFFCCLAVSIAPALVARATHAYAALKEERASTSRMVQRSRMAIIALQVAVSIAFGLGAAKLAGGLYALATEPLGINAANVWDGWLSFSAPSSSGSMWSTVSAQDAAAREKQEQAFDQQMPALRDRLRLNLRALPGVVDVGFSDGGPVGGPFSGFGVRAVARGEIPSPGSVRSFIHGIDADSHYMQLLGCRLLAGRYFTPAEVLQPPGKLPRGPIYPTYAEGATPVILSEPLAQRLFGSANPIGKEIDYLMPTRAGEPSDDFATVVGVVAGIKWLGLTEPAPEEIFRPSVVVPEHFTLRMRGSAGISLAEVQHAVSEASPIARVENFDLLRHRFESELVVPGQRLGLLAFFAMISAAVAALGLASVLLVVIKERDLEIGIRRALGASDRDLAAALLKRVLPWVGLGFAAGLAFPILFPVPTGISVATGPADALWAGALAVAAMLVLIAASLWVPLRRAFRRPVNDLLRAE